ncbi:sugar O-acetyltransferase [Pontibacter sp. 172403-2]|uniref:sugar O-acetyltransferase n=1 Tax=Pontibacter rufus TaxID=2791028 RepID=UPI0018AFA4D7|nr:sugar O-acetyltransferase [Pontibacter sp. 172403-2]MBF9254640.1 sugar O-acetyltransferase [Pontibacter sp. 172403-2]
MKSELQKMLDGELYDASDVQLVEMRVKARTLATQYNAIPVEHAAARKALLQQLLGKTGTNIDIQTPFYCDYGAHIYAGENLFMNFNCIILDCAEVRIGDNVMMGPNVQLYTATHPLQASERIKGPELAYPITIGNNVWLGGGVIVCPGVTIGNNTTIGSGSVVTKDIPANVFAAGNPCKVIKDLPA